MKFVFTLTLLILFPFYVLSQADSASHYLRTGVDLYNSSDYAGAEAKLNKALSFARNGGEQYLSEIYCNLGNTATAGGHIESGLAHYQDALRFTDKMPEGEAYRGKIFTNIGAMYEEQQDLETALTYYEKAEVIARSEKDTTQLADILNNRGLVLETKNQLAEAQALYEEALVYYQKINNPERLAIIYNSLGIVTKQQGKLDKAIEYYNMAISYARELNSDYFTAALSTNVANVYTLQKKYDEAIALSTEALRIARNINEHELITECLESLAMSYSGKGDYKLAHDYLHQYILSHDSLINTSRAGALAEMETKFDVERKELQIETLTAQDERKKFFIGFLTSLCALVVGGALLGFRFTRLKQKKRELEIKAFAEKQERDRIAQDMHDELGSGISRINWITASAQKEIASAEAKEKFGHVETIAQQLSSNMKSLIWLLYSGDVELETLQGRLRELVNQHADDFGFDAQFHFDTQPLLLKQNAARDLFLLVKECVTNLSKHAGATVVKVEMKQAGNDHLQVNIIDNGKGFDEEKITRGHGLNNLRKRVEAWDGQMHVKSDDTGSSFCFSFNISALEMAVVAP